MGSASPRAAKELNRSFFHIRRDRPASTARGRESREPQGHPAWSGLSVFSCWMRRVENQDVETDTWNSDTWDSDVEFAHATRKGQRHSLNKPRPLISTAMT